MTTPNGARVLPINSRLLSLPHDQYRVLVGAIIDQMYFDHEKQEYDPDQPVNGGDLVDAVGQLFENLDLIPAPTADGGQNRT